MTIAAGKTPYHKYAPGSAMSAEAIPFEFLDPAHLTVQVVGGPALTEGVDFELDGDWRAGSGTIRALIDAGASEWELFSDTPDEQQLELAETRAVPLRQYERELDRAAIRARENRRDLGRAITAPIGESGMQLPSRLERSGLYLGFDSDGHPAALPGTGDEASLRPDLLKPDGAQRVGFTAPGTGALLRTAEDALRDIPTLSGYPSTAAAIAAAVEGNFVVGVSESLTVNIPSDAATLQIALDRLTPLNGQCRITLNIESGHALSTRVTLSRKDCSQFRITSADALVPLSLGYNTSIFTGYYAKFPEVLCKINAANQVAGSGASLDGGSITFAPGSGIINTWGGGVATRYGAEVIQDGADFSGGARNAVTGSGLTVWGGVGSAEGAILSGSGYYGGQVAHGGVGGFGSSNASGAFRYGFRATDAGLMDLDKCTAINCGQEAVRCFNATLVNGPGFQGSGAGANGVSVSGASSGNFPSDGTNPANFTGAAIYGAFIANASCVNLVEARLWSAGTNGLRVVNGSIAYAGGANARRNGQSGADSGFDFTVAVGSLLALNGTSLGGVSQQPNFLGPEGIIFDPRPYTVANFALGANQDNYDVSPALRDVIVVTPDNIRNITGLSFGYSGARITIQNGSSTNRIQIKHEDANSNPLSRFNLPGAQQVFIYPGCAATFVYITDRWRLVSVTGPQQLFTYTVAGLPSAAMFLNAIVYVSNAAGGAVQAFSDGTNWRRVDDRAVVA